MGHYGTIRNKSGSINHTAYLIPTDTLGNYNYPDQPLIHGEAEEVMNIGYDYQWCTPFQQKLKQLNLYQPNGKETYEFQNLIESYGIRSQDFAKYIMSKFAESALDNFDEHPETKMELEISRNTKNGIAAMGMIELVPPSPGNELTDIYWSATDAVVNPNTGKLDVYYDGMRIYFKLFLDNNRRNKDGYFYHMHLGDCPSKVKRQNTWTEYQKDEILSSVDRRKAYQSKVLLPQFLEENREEIIAAARMMDRGLKI